MVLSNIWLLVDGLLGVVTRPHCILSFRLLRAANLEVAREVKDCKNSTKYNKCFLNEYALRPGAQTLMKGYGRMT